LITSGYPESSFEDKIALIHPDKEHIMKKKVILWVVIAILLVGVLIQLVPLAGRGANPAVVAEPNWDSPQTRALAKRACFDCHSNETVWPWYSYVAPVSWLVYNDVREGRSRMNFSDWSSKSRPANEIIDEIQGGDMPPSIYLLQHPTARLTDAEKQQLITGLQNSLP
jgi:mono/diheme cytochrome c family protein